MFTRIYALAVCFASILCIAISTGIGLYDIVQINFPKLTMDSYRYQNLQSNEAYRRSHPYPGMTPAYPVTVNPQAGTTSRSAPVAKAAQNEAPPSDEEISKLREQQLAIALDNVRHDAQRSLI
tara:strand:+ start:101 stop:469 length:369 start_codon:yes stop_codon:yes gene_type:complete